MRRLGLLLCALVGCGESSSQNAVDAPLGTLDAGVADAPVFCCDQALSPPDAASPDAGAVDAAPVASDAAVPTVWYAGVNLAGAEFGEQNLPGVYETDYIYPNAGEVDYFVGKGLNIFRIAFRWERLQRALNADFDATELGRLDAIVGYATAAGAEVILDPHNYARYNGDVLGSAQLPYSAFADFWGRLADHYAANPRVIFGLVNEPNTMPTEDWLAAANAAIAAIRDAGASNLVLVPGNGWTGAWTWSETWYGTPNAQVMLGVVDPAGNYAYEVHQYLDTDGSGTHAPCVSTTIGAERLAGFTQWLRDHGRRAFLGEFAGANNVTCRDAVEGMLDHIDANRERWIGWSWWAAGPWWGNYMFTLEPSGPVDAPQLEWLLPHL